MDPKKTQADPAPETKGATALAEGSPDAYEDKGGDDAHDLPGDAPARVDHSADGPVVPADDEPKSAPDAAKEEEPEADSLEAFLDEVEAEMAAEAKGAKPKGERREPEREAPVRREQPAARPSAPALKAEDLDKPEQWQYEHPATLAWQEKLAVEEEIEQANVALAKAKENGDDVEAAVQRAMVASLTSRQKAVEARFNQLAPDYNRKLAAAKAERAQRLAAPAVIEGFRKAVNDMVANTVKTYPTLDRPGIKGALRDIFVQGLHTRPEFNQGDEKKLLRAVARYAIENGFAVTRKKAGGAPEPGIGGSTSAYSPAEEIGRGAPAKQWKNPSTGKPEAVPPGYTADEYAAARKHGFTRQEIVEFRQKHGRNIFD